MDLKVVVTLLIAVKSEEEDFTKLITTNFEVN